MIFDIAIGLSALRVPINFMFIFVDFAVDIFGDLPPFKKWLQLDVAAEFFDESRIAKVY